MVRNWMTGNVFKIPNLGIGIVIDVSASGIGWVSASHTNMKGFISTNPRDIVHECGSCYGTGDDCDKCEAGYITRPANITIESMEFIGSTVVDWIKQSTLSAFNI